MSEAVRVLCYAGCGTCKKALKWLGEHRIDVELRAIVDQPPRPEELEAWISASGLPVRKWLNTSGQSYRALGKAKIDAASDADLKRWLASDGKLIKRPVLIQGGKVLVGFSPEAYGALLVRR